MTLQSLGLKVMCVNGLMLHTPFYIAISEPRCKKFMKHERNTKAVLINFIL